MLQIGTIDFNGGHREYFDVPVVIEKIIGEVHWKNLWLKTTQKLHLKVITLPIGAFKNICGDNINFSEYIIVHDFARNFLDMNVGDILVAKIGYADQNQQYWHGVNTFSIAILRQEEVIQLVQ